MNILIIDDEGRIRNMVQSQLMAMNLGAERIDTAQSAAQARSMLKNCYYEIILCDIVMPEENGIEFAGWALERYPDIKLIFLTAYADVRYMKPAISMHSFDYILQPVSSEELRGVVERAIAKIGIEKRNRELISRGEFFDQREDTILDARTFRYLEGEKEENGYIRRVIRKHNPYGPGVCIYLPVLVQIQAGKPTEAIEIELKRLIYQNILDEIFGQTQARCIVLLREEEFFVLLLWPKERDVSREVILNKLENMRILFRDLLHLQIGIYCGEACAPEQLADYSRPLFEAQKNNVRKESQVFSVGRNSTGNFSHSFDIQVNTWKKLLEEKKFDAFSESILFYIEKGPAGCRIGAETMMQLHQRVTELVLGFLIGHQIGSDRIFDSGLSYLDYMNSWSELGKFREALNYIAKKLGECFDESREFNPVEEVKSYVRQRIDEDMTVVEIADYIGMNPEYCTKLFKKATGYTLKEYIIREKIEAAKILLRTTELPVTLVASHVGYGNYSNFTRSFKQSTGLTPVEYRNESPGSPRQLK